MSFTAQYKSYIASIEFSEEDACYVGEVIGMKNNIMGFDGNTIEEAYSRFLETIDFYLEVCKDEGMEAEVPTTISISLPTDLYLKVSEKAESKGLTVRKLIAEALTVIS